MLFSLDRLSPLVRSCWLKLGFTSCLSQSSGDGGSRFQVASMTGNIEVVKSPADQKHYKLIKLQNGLTALLIHDPTIKDSEGSAAAEVITPPSLCS